MNRMNRTLSIVATLGALLCAAGLLLGCPITEENTHVTAPPPPTLPVEVKPAGACEVEGTSINCVDASESEPAGEIARVRWTLRRGSATEVASRTADPRDSVSFGPGLAAGTYAVDQLVEATDGNTGQRTYSNLEVTEF